jgi:uncharacterized delta-60 repeat protein
VIFARGASSTIAALACALVCLPAAASGGVLPASGLLDAGFGGAGIVTMSGGNSFAATSVVVQPSGDIVVEGQEQAGTGPSITVSRYLPSGSPDRCFGSRSCTGDGTVIASQGQTDSSTALALQSNGKILAAGGIRSGSRKAPFGLGVVRLNANGTLDRSFGEDGVAVAPVPGCRQASAAAVAQAPQTGDIVLVGSAACRPHGRLAVAELTPSGAPVVGFGTDGLTKLPFASAGFGVAVQPNGEIVATGFSGYNLKNGTCLVVRITPSGGLDGGFGLAGDILPSPGYCRVLYDAAVLSDGTILASGSGFADVLGPVAVELSGTGNPLAALGSGGTANPGFATISGAGSDSRAIAAESNGTIVLGSTNGTVASMTATGQPDTQFGSAGVATLSAPGATSTAVNGVAANAAGTIVYAAGTAVIKGHHELVIAAFFA